MTLLPLPQMLFVLFALHFAFDFPLQGDTVAVQKNRHTDNALSKAVPWHMWLTAHAFTQGLGVLIATQSLTCACFETAAHWVIDFGKCEKWFGMYTDQGLHLLCKVGYVLLILRGAV